MSETATFDDHLYAEQTAPAPNDPLDTDSPSQRNTALRKQKRAEEERIEVLQAMLSTNAGRSFIAFVMFDMCGFTHSTVDVAGSAPFSAFRAGQRDIALKLHRMLHSADKTGYVAMLSEHIDQM